MTREEFQELTVLCAYAFPSPPSGSMSELFMRSAKEVSLQCIELSRCFSALIYLDYLKTCLLQIYLWYSKMRTSRHHTDWLPFRGNSAAEFALSVRKDPVCVTMALSF